MGWTYCERMSRKELIADIKKGSSRQFRNWRISPSCWRTETCLASACVGNNLWTVWEFTSEFAESEDSPITETATTKVIILFLLGKSGGAWGYKDINESMGPLVYSCPLAYLDMVPESRSEFSQGWREKVREYQAKRNMKLVVGDCVRLHDSYKPSDFRIVCVRPLKGLALNGGGVYSLPRKALKEKVSETA
jgi:hypothetical protein